MTTDVQAKLDKLVRRQERNERNAHARGLLQGICAMLKPGDVVFDCGANVGAVTGPLSQTGATIHAFEPDPYAFEKLQKKFGRTDNVTLHNAAVGVTSGTVRLMRATNFDDNPKAGSVKSTIVAGAKQIDESEGAGFEVELISLPDFIRKTLSSNDEIAFLKMDVEGAELELLEEMNAQDLFENVRLTVAETHEHKFPDLVERFGEMREQIEQKYPQSKVNLDWI